MSKGPSIILVCTPQGSFLRVLQPKERTLVTYQSIVGGYIEFARATPFEICCNEDGFSLGLPQVYCPLWDHSMLGTYFVARNGSSSLRVMDLATLRAKGYRFEDLKESNLLISGGPK
jgi:hypothetical protein